jgi:hypothetical protein
MVANSFAESRLLKVHLLNTEYSSRFRDVTLLNRLKDHYFFKNNSNRSKQLK